MFLCSLVLALSVQIRAVMRNIFFWVASRAFEVSLWVFWGIKCSFESSCSISAYLINNSLLCEFEVKQSKRHSWGPGFVVIYISYSYKVYHKDDRCRKLCQFQSKGIMHTNYFIKPHICCVPFQISVSDIVEQASFPLPLAQTVKLGSDVSQYCA